MPAPDARRAAPETDIPASAYDEEMEAPGLRSRLETWLHSGSPLKPKEAKANRDILIKSILKYAELADDAIPLLSKTRAPVQIWSTIDDREAEVLADCLLDVALRWAVAAQVVRAVVRTYSWLEVGMITVPRFKLMIDYYLREGFILAFSFKLRPNQRG